MKLQKFFKRSITAFVVLLYSTFAYGQELVFEVTWNDMENVTYRGLVVLMNNEGGFIKNHYYSETAGSEVWVTQDIKAEVDIDRLGNQIIYLIGSNPVVDNENAGYSPDTFVIYPNNTWFTQDANGNSSSDIRTNEISESNWQDKFREYRINSFGNDTQRNAPRSNSTIRDTQHL